MVLGHSPAFNTPSISIRNHNVNEIPRVLNYENQSVLDFPTLSFWLIDRVKVSLRIYSMTQQLGLSLNLSKSYGYYFIPQM
jgi:hypothetical protein